MRLNRLIQFTAAGAIALGMVSAFPGQAAASDRYFCAQLDGVYHTFIHTSRGQSPLLNWVDTIGEFDPETRCIEVSKRFQRAHDNGTLRHIRTGEVNNYPVLCAVRHDDETCNSDNVLVTLALGSDRHAVAQQLLNVRSLAARRVIKLSSDERLETYADGELSYDLEVMKKVLPLVEEELIPVY